MCALIAVFRSSCTPLNCLGGLSPTVGTVGVRAS